jgi:hypothetical protein
MASKKRKHSSDYDSDEQAQSSSSSSSNAPKRRQFLHQWLTIYPWLIMEGTGENITLYCRDCKQAKLSNEFAKGKTRPSGGWKKEYLQRHCDSNQHRTQAPEVRKMAAVVQSRGFFPTISSTEQQTLGLLHNVYYVVENGLPVSKSDSLHCLVDFQLTALYHNTTDQREQQHDGLPSALPQRLCLSKSHRTNYSSWEFVHALNSVVENTDISKLKAANFFSLLIDESNDISVTKNLMMYVQFVNIKSHSVEVMFLKNTPLPACDADSIVSAIVHIFKNIGVDLKTMVMFTSDGAAVMLGCNNGVYVKLKGLDMSHLIEYHCVAHREALAVGSAYRSVSYFVRLESVIKAVFSHFSHSSVRTSKLQNVFTVLEKKYIRLKKIHDIRWLSRVEAIEAVVKCHDALVIYFEDLSEVDVVAAGLAKQLKTYRFILSLHFLLDVLSTLGQLSKTLQILAYHPCDACRKINEVCDVLQQRYLSGEDTSLTFRWGPKAAECIANLGKGSIVIAEPGSVEKKQLVKDCVAFVTEVVKNLKARFPPTQQGVVEAAKIFDPRNLPSGKDELAAYGEGSVDILAIQYSDFVDRSLCQSEWELLKHCMSANYKNSTLQAFSLKLAADHGMKVHYPSLSILAEIILTFPASTAELERGFSVQNLIKSKTRNRLGSYHLDQLIRLKLNSPQIGDFPFHQAYLNWLADKDRRYIAHSQTLPQPVESDESD